MDKANVNKVLPWVHKAISDAKRLLLDVHHRIDDDFLQNYLNEFVINSTEDILNIKRWKGLSLLVLIVNGMNYR